MKQPLNYSVGAIPITLERVCEPVFSSPTKDAVSLSDLYKRQTVVLSFELFPPKTDGGFKTLGGHLESLLQFSPHFVTCTYGAGGSTRDKTLSTLALVRTHSGVPLASHLTCVGSTIDELRAYLRQATEQGVSYIVAIRGDAPNGDGTFKATSGGFSYGNELVQLIRSEFPHFGVVVGGYPETHPEALNAESDLENLKRKVDCGADVVITQLFYVNEHFLRFRDKCEASGISVPVVPGVLPITNYKQVQRITALCGAQLPEDLTRKLEHFADDPEGQFKVGTDHAIEQITGLLDAKVSGIHFYVLNQSRATSSILKAVGLSGHG